MLPVVDKPLIQIIVEDLHNAGIEDIMIIIGRNKECIVNHFDRNVELEERLIAKNKTKELESIKTPESLASIVFKRQIVPKGTGHAIEMAKTWVGNDPFVMCFGDEMFVTQGDNVFQQIIKEYEEHKKMVIACTEVETKDIPLYGIVRKSGNGKYFKVEEFVEKPTIDKAHSNIANAGPAVLTPKIFDYLKDCKESNFEITVTDAYAMALQEDNLYGRLIDGTKLDLGNRSAFVKANIYMAMKEYGMEDEIVSYVDKIKK